MKAEGATREEIRSAVQAQLTEWGVELPEQPPPRRGHGNGPLADLTEEQRAEIHETVKAMHEEGATREEIRAAVLAQYGIELPERPLPHRGRGNGPLADLTEEQRVEIHETVKAMHEEGATREEIRAAVLAQYGVELPERPRLRHRRGEGPFADLTEEQRAAIHETVRELRSQGATREQIRVAIGELLEGYGIERPDNPDAEPEPLSKTVVSQNTPNPFNPVTTIAYDLSEPSDVTLRVYAVTGQEVATLVSSHQPSGHYEVAWDGSGFANGVYMYRLEAGPFSETRRMLLLK
jgi:Spy/CpxP family protein refolding chaperone